MGGCPPAASESDGPSPESLAEGGPVEPGQGLHLKGGRVGRHHPRPHVVPGPQPRRPRPGLGGGGGPHAGLPRSESAYPGHLSESAYPGHISESAYPGHISESAKPGHGGGG